MNLVVVATTFFDRGSFRLHRPTISLLGIGNKDVEDVVIVYVGDGWFHLVALMIVNPRIKVSKYEP